MITPPPMKPSTHAAGGAGGAGIGKMWLRSLSSGADGADCGRNDELDKIPRLLRGIMAEALRRRGLRAGLGTSGRSASQCARSNSGTLVGSSCGLPASHTASSSVSPAANSSLTKSGGADAASPGPAPGFSSLDSDVTPSSASSTKEALAADCKVGTTPGPGCRLAGRANLRATLEPGPLRDPTTDVLVNDLGAAGAAGRLTAAASLVLRAVG
mmetsp:Transcript_23506/g.60070  ORF Transcript_23506/g.60070 Transcript_23506/m.60070 type:complete len:213 (+) Transcript_23506:1021-1659(+)